MLPFWWPRSTCRVSNGTRAARSLRPNVCFRSWMRRCSNPQKASLPKRSLYFLAARLRPFCHAVLFIQSSFLPRTESSVADLAEDFLLDDPAAVLVCGDRLG